jgi:radical SAM family uncharacterized protein
MSAPLSLWKTIEVLLDGVSKPARYIGGELGAKRPQHATGKVAWLLCYPDAYEVGLPNQGLQILYEILNERDDSVAERAYAPWVDMEEAMRNNAIPLFSLENHFAAKAFDVIGFNLAAELTFTNVMNMIDLAGLAVRASERENDDPLVIAGGHCVYNPEPLADYIDAFVLGDGEEVVGEITALLKGSPRSKDRTKRALLRSLAQIEGVYVPSLYEVTYNGAAVQAVTPLPGSDVGVVVKRDIADLGEWPYPKEQLVPLTEVVHDRLNVEVFRGCTRGCRFCQAGMITRPVRERPREQVVEMVRSGLARTGYEEVALTSLSTADFSQIEETVTSVMNAGPDGARVSVSLPSLRVDAFTVSTAATIQQGRRTGLTFAPEGGTWRMRKVINKLISEEDLFAAVDAAFSQGWRRVKLYFLIGLPTERDEDVIGIAELGSKCVEIGRRYHKSVTVTASVGGFVPKAQTPFQWAAQDTVAELTRKVELLRSAARDVKGLTIRWHEPAASVAEGITSRGDRRVGAVIERVWRNGGVFQEWSEFFSLDCWQEALAAEGLHLDTIVHRPRGNDELLAWAHLSAGLHEEFLWDEWQNALAEAGLEDCRWTPCYDCGVCTSMGVEHVVASATPPAGGSQGTGQRVAIDLRRPA